mmetsp:Transcript_49545/g.112472  ORF Transcript_49545/g.112472 Transcript_49545/m.112472 type:complete len:296 (+) Transcript_49545:497-1384(+)
MFRMSAPLKSSASFTTLSKSMSPFLVMGPEWIFKMSSRCASFGKGISIFRSSRPGRKRAGSRMSGRLVAMTILTAPLVSKPSICASSSMSVRWISRSAEVPSLKRDPPIASISSMKMTHGWWSRAYPNISRMTRADSPMYLSTMADATTLRNVAFTLDAKARARSVFPVPGGPYRSTPFGGLMPTRLKSSGLVSGSSMVSRRSRIWSFRPPISEKLMPFSSSAFMLNTVGSTSRGSGRMMVKVVMSSATRVPGISLALSNLFLQPTTYRGPEEALTIKRVSSSCFSTSPIICPML